MFDPVRQEAFFADNPHVGERTSNAARQKLLAQAGQRWRVRTAEQIRRDRQVKLVDEILFE